MEKFSLIITAGGTSTRYGNKNKLLEKIIDKTVIEETVNKFINNNYIDQIILSANIGIIDELKKLFQNDKIEIIKGGSTRQKSVYNALQHVNNDYVLIHDGARPLISQDVIDDTIKAVLKYGAVSDE